MLALVVPSQLQPALEKGGTTFDRQWYLFFEAAQLYASTAGGILRYGVRADRQSIDLESLLDGTLWIETDTGLKYQWQAATLSWVYISGVYARTQAQLSALGATLGVDDTGLLVNVTDFAHILQWTGAAWSWGPGEQGSGMMVLFEEDPTGNGWHLYDGTANVKYLKATGATGTVTLPDLVSVTANAAYAKAGSPNAAAVAAVAPGLTGSTAAASTGISAAAGVPSLVVAETLAGVNTVAANNHTHTITVTDPTHLHTKGTLAVDATGEPRNLVRRPWFRQ